MVSGPGQIKYCIIWCARTWFPEMEFRFTLGKSIINDRINKKGDSLIFHIKG